MYRTNQTKERLSLPCFINFFKTSFLGVFLFISSTNLEANNIKEYFVEVLVFEQLESDSDEDLSPVSLNLNTMNLISLLHNQVADINTDAIARSFKVEVTKEFLGNLDILDLDFSESTQPNEEEANSRHILKINQWFKRSDRLKELNNIYRRLDRRKEYKVLHKISWMQPALPNEETPYIHEIFDTHGLLIRLYQSRYLHLDLIGYMNGNLASESNADQIQVIKLSALQGSIPEDVKQINIPISSQILYLDTVPEKDKILVEIAKKQPTMITEGLVEYALKEERRIFKNESHFFDHPKMGIIVSVYDSSL